MNNYKRKDGRKLDDLRPIEAKVGVVPRADGSAYFKIGNTEAYAAVYGPRHMYPRFLQNPEKGVLRCNYNMMPFSGSGERVRPGPSRRSKEISLVTEKALLPVVNLDEFPNAVVDVFIELSQTDAGSRCAGICAASMALADAGIKMRDLVAAISVGKINTTLLVDLDYNEEAFDGEVSDIPVAMVPSTGEFTLLQMDGIIDKETLLKALSMAKSAIDEINKIQVAALKKKYEIIGCADNGDSNE
ncbi:MAG: exosome complex exonuclease Rrp41 [archaeon]